MRKILASISDALKTNSARIPSHSPVSRVWSAAPKAEIKLLDPTIPDYSYSSYPAHWRTQNFCRWRDNPGMENLLPKDLQKISHRTNVPGLLSLNQWLFEMLRNPATTQEHKGLFLRSSRKVIFWACTVEINKVKNKAHTSRDTMNLVTELIFDDLKDDDLGLPKGYATGLKSELLTEFVRDCFALYSIPGYAYDRFIAYKSYVDDLIKRYSQSHNGKKLLNEHNTLIDDVCLDCVDVVQDAFLPDCIGTSMEFEYYAKLLRHAGISLCTTGQHLGDLLEYFWRKRCFNIYKPLNELEKNLNSFRNQQHPSNQQLLTDVEDYVSLICSTCCWIPFRNDFIYPVFQELTKVICGKIPSLANASTEDLLEFRKTRDSVLKIIGAYVKKCKDLAIKDTLQPKNLSFKEFDELATLLQVLDIDFAKYLPSGQPVKNKVRG